MSNYIINDSELIAIADAIRSKNGTTDEYTTAEMPSAIAAIISGGGDPTIEELEVTSNGTYAAPEGVDGYSPIVVNVPQDGAPPAEAFVITGDCEKRFANNGWAWYLDLYGNQITTKDITVARYMFQNSSSRESIPFAINAKSTQQIECTYMFMGCSELKEIGDLVNFYPSNMSGMFSDCFDLRYLPNFVDWNWDRMQTYNYADFSRIFTNCFSLRSIPEEILGNLWGVGTSAYSSNPYYSTFYGCRVLDEIKGLGVQPATITSNFFNTTFNNCERLKEMTFAMNEDGTPKTANWKAQTIDLSQYVGWTSSINYILNYNSGITRDTYITNDEEYQALKDHPDSFCFSYSYSRYNHDSAVNTINSLPDTSAYLSANGGTNTIKFKGAAGSATDGGAINTLTAEEIAVATAKGWTVSLV